MKFTPLAAACVAAIAVLAGSAFADEGMWTFDSFPSAKVKTAYGVDVTPEWLDHVRGAAVRLSTGCSGSVVTRSGLVLTNNHCVEGCAENLSVEGHDYFKAGYLAAKWSEEKGCPGMQAEILTSITDVTKRVTAAGLGLTGERLVKARTAVSSTIENDSCVGDAKYKCQVVDLYHGGQFKLYRYRKYSDVRLVFLPGEKVGFFGGDPDNFNFPRYDLDAAFLRLYDGGAPATMDGHLRWNAAPPKAGEPVFVAGNPGGTDRQLTVSQLETQRTLILPVTLGQYSELRGRLIRFAEESADHKRMAGNLLFGLENSYKVYYGRQGGAERSRPDERQAALRGGSLGQSRHGAWQSMGGHHNGPGEIGGALHSLPAGRTRPDRL